MLMERELELRAPLPVVEYCNEGFTATTQAAVRFERRLAEAHRRYKLSDDRTVQHAA